MDGRRNANILWGVLLILAGVVFAGNALEFWDVPLFFPGWWTLFIILPCLVNVIRCGFHTAPMVGIGVGILLLLAAWDVYSYSTIWKLVLPLALIFIGLRLVFYRKNRVVVPGEYGDKAGKRGYSSVFSRTVADFTGQRFEGASVTAVFGTACLDLRGAILERDATVEATAVFGGVEILLPPDVKLQVSSVPIFGGVSRHRPEPLGSLATIFLNAVCVFGGVDVK